MVLDGLLLFLSLCAAAATGTVKGTIRYDDGIPFIGRVIIVSEAQTAWITPETDINGYFTASIPAGPCKISVNGSRQPAQPFMVKDGEVTEANVTLKREGGVVLTLLTPDLRRVQVVGKVTGTAWIERGHPINSRPFFILGDGRFWLPDVPADSKAFFVIVEHGVHGQYVTTEQWTFTDPDPRRALTMIVPKLGRLAVRICDPQGQPLRNAKLAFAAVSVPQNAGWKGGNGAVIENPVTDNDG